MVRAQGSNAPLLVAAQLNNNLGSCMLWEDEGFTLDLPHGEASEEVSARYFFRLPQENQSAETLTEHFGRYSEPRTGAARVGTGNFLPRARATFSKRARSRMIDLSFRLVRLSIAVCGSIAIEPLDSAVPYELGTPRRTCWVSSGRCIRCMCGGRLI
jgi:hypothetical protein